MTKYSFNPIIEIYPFNPSENTFSPPRISFNLPGASVANAEKSHEEDKARYFARHYKRTDMCRVLFYLIWGINFHLISVLFSEKEY